MDQRFIRERSNRPDDDEPCCSFCGRKQSEVQAMFRSEDARICDRCVLRFKQGDAR